VQEKIDGSNLLITIDEDHPKLINRDQFIKKGETKKTASKQQFKPAWNWVYKNIDKFNKLHEYVVCGEWMINSHGIHYDQLEDYFYAYDLYDKVEHKFVDVSLSKQILDDCGFKTNKFFYYGKYKDIDYFINTYSKTKTELAKNEIIEGLVFKTGDGKTISEMLKFVREDFVPGKFFDVDLKNKLR
jgi:atypical dual specificity phosphatase